MSNKGGEVTKTNFLIYGLPTTGKTTFVSHWRKSHGENEVIIDSDNVFRIFDPQYFEKKLHVHFRDEHRLLGQMVAELMESAILARFPRITNLWVSHPDYAFVRTPDAMEEEWRKRGEDASPNTIRMVRKWASDAVAHFRGATVLEAGDYIGNHL